MTRVSRVFGTVALLAGLMVVGTMPASANHSWGGYHWSRSTSPFTVTFANNLTSSWSGNLTTAAAQWSVTSGPCNNPANPVRCAVVAGSGNPRTCKSTAGKVQVCNASYGNTGWLGIAGISVNGTHITSGYVKINDTYFNTAQYNTPNWRQFVMSQEVGHTLGLDHQDTNFNNADLLDGCGRGSCMDYSNDPSNQTTPNQHDYDQLVTIYSHFDAGAFAPPAFAQAGAAADEVDADNPNSWGQATRFNHNGRAVEFTRDFGPRGKVITLVLWAE